VTAYLAAFPPGPRDPLREWPASHIFRAMPNRNFSEAQIEAAIAALNEPERLRDAESLVAAAAPQLQGILAQALDAGGWFTEAHEGELRKALALESEAERTTALRTLLADETRMGMMVGVAVGWALREELAAL
jgi:hypothetical protein